jgi:hypothetical protein
MDNPEFPPAIDPNLEKLIRLEEIMNSIHRDIDYIADCGIVMQLPALRDRADELLDAYHGFNSMLLRMIKFTKEGHTKY